MKRITKLIKATFVFYLVLILMSAYAYAEYVTKEDQKGRYVLAMISGTGGIYARASYSRKTPAVVLDSVLGIVWRCTNVQDERPRWIKTDLGKNTGKPLTAKKYIIKLLEWPSGELKIPAVVLDIEEGKVWTLPNIMAEDSSWIQKDLLEDLKKQE